MKAVRSDIYSLKMCCDSGTRKAREKKEEKILLTWI